MLRSLKNILFVVLLTCGLQPAWAFSLLGPIGNGGDSWQVPTIGYGLPGDLGAPKNIGEGYRRNTPVMYYAYNENFSGFFGASGETAIDQAFGILNNLTNVSAYSSSLSEFPLNSESINYTAQSLGLTDLKSYTLSAMLEQLGLAEPERYTWTLRNRYLPSGGVCPIDDEYLVIQRNFDISPTPLNELQYSAYVNGTLYSYYIDEICTGPNPLAVTVPFDVDPYAQIYTAVASGDYYIEPGVFYGGLTRDDVAGLRYLLQTNNVNYESPDAGSFLLSVTTNLNSLIQFPANTNAPYGFGTYDLGALLSAAQTNSLTNLYALYPGLIVNTSSNYFILATNTTVTSYYAPPPVGSDYGSPPQLVLVTNYSYYPLTIYVDTFANVVTNHYYPNTTNTLLTTNVEYAIVQPAGTLETNVSYQKEVLTNVPSGDFYLLTAGQCPTDIISPLQTNIISVTNLITTPETNVVTTTNTTTAGFFYSQSVITSYKSYDYNAYPVNCAQVAQPDGLYQGIERIQFVKIPDGSLDPLTGNFIQPITNTYTMMLVTNSQAVKETFQRVLTTPDFLFSAADIVGNANGAPVVFPESRNVNFNQNDILPGLAGPGTIDTPTTITFDKVGQIYGNGGGFSVLNSYPYSEYTQTPLPVLAWGSFDGTTNAPVVYPNGTSIANYEDQVLIQISPATLSVGTNGVAYPATTFTASGGAFSPPFTWSQTGLPTGLTLSSSGTLSGTPTESGTFDFTLQLTDSLYHSVQWTYAIIIQ